MRPTTWLSASIVPRGEKSSSATNAAGATPSSPDPHPRNVYWEMWGLPMFDLDEPDAVLVQVRECRRTFPEHYVRVLAYDASLGRQTTAMQFLVQRPSEEPGFLLSRTEGSNRPQRYAVQSYATRRPVGTRYGSGHQDGSGD